MAFATAWVVLAHFKPNSVAISRGVGNNGGDPLGEGLLAPWPTALASK